MSDLSFTKEQLQAIKTRDKDILVAAAAGSGKTAVLVERIINIITDAENPIDIDRLLVVTFTEAAANEMKQRISNAILQLLLKNPSDEHLQRQSILVTRANISTIHSFCLNVIRQNFHIPDIDPGFRISDETEILLLKRQVMDKLFEEEYSKEDNILFLDLVESFGDKVHDDALSALVLNIYSFAESNPWPEKFILDATNKFDTFGKASIDETVWAKIIKEDILNSLEYMLERLDSLEKLTKLPNGPFPYYENVVDDRLLVENIIRYTEKSLESLHNSLEEISFGRLKTIKKSDKDLIDSDLKDKFQKIRNKDIKDEINSIKKKYFFKAPKNMLEDIEKLFPLIKYLGELVIKYSNEFAQLKREKNIVDFNDLEHFCMQILLEEGSSENNLIPSKSAIELQNKFHEILIDEYQDSNLVQEIILSAVSKSNNRFMVGDIKQSIYRFRRARPELFIGKYNSFGKTEDSVNLKIDLSKNFRSRKTVIDSINYLFYQLMTEEAGEVIYNESQALYAGASYPENENSSQSTEIILIEQKLDEDQTEEASDQIQELQKTELEAHIIAKRILELQKTLYVQDKEQQRPLRFSDIVILMKSVSVVGEVFIEILKKYDIPAYVNSSDGFFDSLEILTMLAFLQIIDNPRQDIHLITALHSPVYEITPEELLEIRSINNELPFYDSMNLYLSQKTNPNLIMKLNKFTSDLNRWRDVSTFIPVNELIFKIYDETFYYNYVGALQGGDIRQANLRALQEKAVDFEATGFKSIFHFIKYIERIQKIKLDNGSAKIISENENLVRIMTIHKSKGLEFPVVFVSMLGKGFNFMDEKQGLIIHHELGFGPLYMDLENRIRSNTLARLAVSKKIHKESISEELRVFYVALTRAKEKLILTGTLSNLHEKLQNYRIFEDYAKNSLPPYFVLRARNYLDFLMPAVLRHREFNNNIFSNEISDFDTKFEIIYSSHTDVLEEKKEETTIAIELYKSLQNLDLDKNHSGLKYELEKKLSWIYSFESEKALPTKLNITEIKRAFVQDEENFEDEIVFETPSFITEKQELSNVQYGLLTHCIMENLDFKKHDNFEKLKNLVDTLKAKNILTEKEAEAAPLNKVFRFIKSSLASRIRSSPDVRREIPFVLGISPNEIYSLDKEIDERILVHGIIDCFFEEDGNIILVDYKTDYVKDVNEILERYKIQMLIYKKAVERSTGKKVSEIILYLFGIDDFVKYEF